MLTFAPLGITQAGDNTRSVTVMSRSGGCFLLLGTTFAFVELLGDYASDTLTSQVAYVFQHYMPSRVCTDIRSLT